MKSSIITPMGMSPPIATELVEYFEISGEHISDIVLIATNEQKVKESCNIVETALANRYPRLRTHLVELPFSDIQSTEDNIEFMKICANAIREEREVHGCEKVYLNIAGGRNDMSVSLALIGQLLDIDGVFHIISAGVDVVNISLELIKKGIGDLSKADDKIEFYRQNSDKFDEVMFPPISSFNVIQIPSIPFPEEYLGKIMEILLTEDNIVLKEEIKIPWHYIERLNKADLLLIRKDGVYPTPFGKLVASIVKRR